MSSVLDGIRVLDLSWGIARPVAGMLLADQGADVVKVEPPGGDPFRGSAGYNAWLRGRRSLELDLGDGDAGGDRSVFHALARGADVVLTSYSPGTAERLGIGATSLMASNPGLVVCSLSAYGDHPDHCERPGYDALVAARLGILDEQRGHLAGAIGHMHGEGPFLEDLDVPADMPPGAKRPGPIFTYTPWLSMASALLATTGISAALYARLRTGRGQHVETSLLQAALAVTASKWMRVEHNDAPYFRSWIYDRRANKGFFKCSDGRWVEQWLPNPNFVLTSSEGDALVVDPGTGSIRDDPARIPPDPENIVVLAHYFEPMAAAFARFSQAEWVEAARKAGVPTQPVRTPEEALADPALLAESAVVEVEHPDHGWLRQAGIAYHLSRTPGRVRRGVPRVGEHNTELRAEAEAAAAETARPRARAISAAPTPVPAPAPMHGGPLEGVTVLDLGFAVAGPFGTQVLADLGADVIKVNGFRDPWWHAMHIAYSCNRNKRSIGIDLKTPEGQSVLHRVVRQADVVHSNIRQGALGRLGLDEAALRAVNPDIIYCHTRGFEKGPRSDSPGNDQTGLSLAGVTYEDGGTRAGGAPFWSLTSLGDTGNGFLSAIGVIQALSHRARTGGAQAVDTSILNAGLLIGSMASIRRDGSPLPRPQLDASQLSLGPLYRLFQTADGWLCLAAVTETHWARLVYAFGHPEWTADPRFADAGWRLRHRIELEEPLEPHFGAADSDALFALLDSHGVPCEIPNPDFGPGIFDDAEMAARGLTLRMQHPKLGRYESFGRTITFSDTQAEIWGPPPLCGQHTRAIMTGLGYGDDEVDHLVAAKAVFEELWVD
jgi:crotonobetainyl-CoA:carnitine CoA-transferase CaiB-like acyl-CoA transferase